MRIKKIASNLRLTSATDGSLEWAAVNAFTVSGVLMLALFLPMLLSATAYAKTYRYSCEFPPPKDGQTLTVGIGEPAPPGTREVTDWTCSAPDTTVSIVATKVSVDATFDSTVQRRERRTCTVTLNGKSDRYVIVVRFRDGATLPGADTP